MIMHSVTGMRYSTQWIYKSYVVALLYTDYAALDRIFTSRGYRRRRLESREVRRLPKAINSLLTVCLFMRNRKRFIFQ